MRVSAEEGYRIWSSTYEEDSNPLLSLERRIVAPLLQSLNGRVVADVGCGSGWWMRHAQARGAKVFGFDRSGAMLECAARAPALAGRLVLADAANLPVCSAAAGLAICSFVLGYVVDARRLFCELARVARRVVVADLHPEAIRHGWTRSFRANGQRYEIGHYARSRNEIVDAARSAGLLEEWSIEARFGEPERPIFERAGKLSEFAQLCAIPALLIGSWRS